MKAKDYKPLINRIFAGEDGKKFDELLKNICYIGRDIFNKDAIVMSYSAGRQSVYLLLKRIAEEDSSGRKRRDNSNK